MRQAEVFLFSRELRELSQTVYTRESVKSFAEKYDVPENSIWYLLLGKSVEIFLADGWRWQVPANEVQIWQDEQVIQKQLNEEFPFEK
ncbi:hypothetical protein LRY65_03505 [Candidatus Woesebacteria bacterium]|nr:hypothetical protein [Candidatus Woesebacteria bacterium]MCD8506960.1 hypothetical protein [Candidatus Woesebacteria bacterium]MCD8527251.1 hypothetical protein [Candidatus Woesebacteria bacterium]MCD8546618.1 hypothetical protein [Candidatus Woesebacteria bacterium]